MTGCIRGCTRVRWSQGERVRDPRPARAGLLCLPCRDRLAELLAGVAEYAGMLDDVREHGVADELPGIKMLRADPPAPLNLGVVAVEDSRTRPHYVLHDDGSEQIQGPVSITAVLGEWAELVIDLRQLYDQPRTVPELVAFLAGHVDWIAGQSWVVEAYAELDYLHRKLGELVGEPRPRSIGRCPDCQAPLWMPHGDVLACGSCGASWEREQWGVLAAVLAGEVVT